MISLYGYLYILFMFYMFVYLYSVTSTFNAHSALQVFLEPLGQVIGQVKCRQLLLQLATTSAQKTRLQLIGMMLGVQDWSHSFLAKVIPQSGCTDALKSVALDDLQVFLHHFSSLLISQVTRLPLRIA